MTNANRALAKRVRCFLFSLIIAASAPQLPVFADSSVSQIDQPAANQDPAILTAKPPGVKPGSHVYTLKVDRKTRSYLLHVPKNYVGEKLPIVFVLHGAMLNAQMAAWMSRMNEKADQERFFVVYPNGSGGIGRCLLTWNAGGCCGPAKKNGTNDIAFMRSLLSQLKARLSVDEDRIFIAGMSNGGMMAYKMACEMSNDIAAVGSVSGCMSGKSQNPSSPVSVLAFNGTADQVVRYSGGFGRHWTGYKPRCLGVHEAAAYWVSQNHCNETPERQETGHIVRETYRGGLAGSEVCIYTINEGDHVWPGGRLSLPPNPPSEEVSATDVMWDFFKNHPKRRTSISSEAF